MAISRGSEEVRHGRQDGPPDVRLLGGHFSLGSPNAALAVSLLPAMIHIRGNPRLSILVRLVCEEANRPGAASHLVQARLVEVLLVEALRTEGVGARGRGSSAGVRMDVWRRP
jgi:hypothetical protein